MTDDRWHLVLNRYQRDNLLELFHACHYPWNSPHVPEDAMIPLMTGDWMGELYWQLCPPDGSTLDDVDAERCLSTAHVTDPGDVKPNVPAATQVRRVLAEAFVRRLAKSHVPVLPADAIPKLTEEQKERLREAARSVPKFGRRGPVFPFVEPSEDD
jgi:hypothetical protein